LFLGSEVDSERAAVLYTVLESAKLNGLSPQTGLGDVINRMATGHPSSRLADLLPWTWQPQIDNLAASPAIAVIS
jgi:transposase